MKRILILTSLLTLLGATGCIVSERGHYEHPRHVHHEEVIVSPPVIIAPEVRVRER